MIELCPIPLFYRITNKARIGLYHYQLKIYGFKLELPSHPITETQEELIFLMKQAPHRQVKVK